MENYFQLIKKNFLEWENKGYCLDAAELNKKIGEDYFSTTNPHFFTGNIDAELVLIHLNPKRNKNSITNQYAKLLPKDNKSAPDIGGFDSFEAYINYFTNFGKVKYGLKSKRNHKSPFDHKQIRFIRPFEIIPLNHKDKFQNLENVIDKKLQLELIPFGSENFNFNKIGINNLARYIDPILNLLTLKDRKYIVFCGRVFEELLDKYITQKNKIIFKLTKKDGEATINDFEIINIKISINGNSIICAIAPQFAKQGYPVEQYGQKIKTLYGKFD